MSLTDGDRPLFEGAVELGMWLEVSDLLDNGPMGLSLSECALT